MAAAPSRRCRRPAVERRELSQPGSGKPRSAQFLDGSIPQWQGGRAPRAVLADWITAPDNPYFARAAVNRIWGHFFGVGLVDPVDDFRDDNLPSHPELLDDLARLCDRQAPPAGCRGECSLASLVSGYGPQRRRGHFAQRISGATGSFPQIGRKC
jgi:Protein of unknown function (DUF1553)